MIRDLFILFFGAAVVNNFVLYRFLGICPFLGVSKKTESAAGMGAAVTFVMTLANLATWLVYNYVLEPNGLLFLQIVSYILIIATLVQLIEMYMKKYQQVLFKAFGIYLPLITTNCAILGLTLINTIDGNDLISTVVFALGGGAGFTLALLIMSGIRERLELADLPKPLEGAPIALITAGILAMAFGGFGGML
ncbi:MAG: RnfABCDGE type electron transport complex subunit A [Candidatus Undinarchaeales archaeon]|jgi:electron transport complex protein RnfA|nr:RnfABCDGE type electron transport complex subunit A [Candidatus Undinarchaeales archaeon]